MALTIREQIIRAAVVLVNTARPAGVPECRRTVMEPTEAKSLPSMNCFPFREPVNSLVSGRWGPIVTRKMSLRFVVYNQGDETTPADASADAALAWLTQTLAGQNFGGLSNDCNEAELNWQYDEGLTQVVGVAVDFAIEYQTLSNDQTQTGRKSA